MQALSEGAGGGGAGAGAGPQSLGQRAAVPRHASDVLRLCLLDRSQAGARGTTYQPALQLQSAPRITTFRHHS